jgi:hypothetical protein
MNTEQTIVDNNDYKFRVKKTWIPQGKSWHIQFFTESIYEHRFEIFLTTEELARLKEIL